MTNNANGDGSPERLARQQVPMNAVRELVRAIETLGAQVRRVDLGDEQIFLVAVRDNYARSPELPNAIPIDKRKSVREVESRTDGVASTSLDEIVAAACRRLRVTRKELVTKSNRRRPVSVARFLIARHASVAGVASVRQVAAMLGRKAQSNSLYVGIGRLKKTIPEFSVPLAQFLAGGSEPSSQLQDFLGATWSSTAKTTAQSTSDAEIGARLAVALPTEMHSE